MKMYFLIFVLLLAGCQESVSPRVSRPAVVGPLVNPPVSLRQQNYGGGSCMYASAETLLMNQNQHSKATQWRRTFRGGASVWDLANAGNRTGVSFAYTSNGDEAFLEWASRTRRGAVIYFLPRHAIAFTGYSGDHAYLIDPNRTDRHLRIKKKVFLRWWHHYGGKAWTPMYSPQPPQPWM